MVKISMDNVSFGYGTNHDGMVLKNINLAIDSTGLTALIGSNGSGKTTLGKLMTGILKPVKGRVLIDGEDTTIMSLGKIGSKIGYMFQDPDRQIFAPTVEEELSFVMRVQGYEKVVIHDRVREALSRFHLEHVKDSFPFYLSRGEKQRLAIAAVLVNQPGFLILDEPTTALDVKRRNELVGILKELLQKGIGMLVIGHDHKLINAYADRVIELCRGEVRSDRKNNGI